MESRTKIVVIIVATCAILVGFICCMVAVFHTSLETIPRLEFSPLPSEAGSALISYRQGNWDDTSHWIDSLNNLIKTYQGNSRDSTIVKDWCSADNPRPYQFDEVCKFDYQSFGFHCTNDEDWGYSRRSPCVLLRMNKVIGWEPEVYTKADIDNWALPRDMPDELQEHIKQSAADNGGEPPKMVWVSCSGVNVPDVEWLGELEYTPWMGFPAYYFPYMGNPDYQSPIVALRIRSPKSSVLINIRCRVWAKNIIYSVDDGHGMVDFQLLID